MVRWDSYVLAIHSGILTTPVCWGPQRNALLQALADHGSVFGFGSLQALILLILDFVNVTFPDMDQPLPTITTTARTGRTLLLLLIRRGKEVPTTQHSQTPLYYSPSY